MMIDMRQKIAAAVLFATLGCSGGGEPPAQHAPVSATTPAPVRARDERGVILFLGTSLTAGYGVGADHAFPALIQNKLDSAHLPFRISNAGLSGETSAGGLRRLDWSLQQPVDLLVLELGANDGLRGLSVNELEANLDTIITRTKHRYPKADVLIAGMEAPPNLGIDYTSSFRTAYREVAREHNSVLIPFLLDGVATDAKLNQEDGIHPNIEGHRHVADNVWKALEPMLQKRIMSARAPAARE